jgi:hypothetical protein
MPPVFGDLKIEEISPAACSLACQTLTGGAASPSVLCRAKYLESIRDGNPDSQQSLSSRGRGQPWFDADAHAMGRPLRKRKLRRRGQWLRPSPAVVGDSHLDVRHLWQAWMIMLASDIS